jgi:hypothetical protein
MKPIEWSTEKFRRSLDQLTRAIVFGNTHLKIGRGVLDTIRQDAVIDGVAPVFWGTSVTAHLNEAQLLAFKIFDSRAGTLTIEYLLELAENGKAEFKEAEPESVSRQTEEARKQITDLRRSKLGPLEEKRDRVLAHTDPTVVTNPEKLTRETTVTFMDLDAIFETATDIVSSISVSYSGAALVTDLLHDDDYEMIIQYVADIKHRHADRLERLGAQAQDIRRPKRPPTPNWD